jgi:hypothetical protein
MTDLYRGLLEILVMRCIEQIESLRAHIRSHNSGKSEIIDFDIGVTGFWNLLLEIVFTMFTVIFLISGICLIAALAISSYPLAAFINYGAWLLNNIKNPQEKNNHKGEDLQIIKQTKND